MDLLVCIINRLGINSQSNNQSPLKRTQKCYLVVLRRLLLLDSEFILRRAINYSKFILRRAINYQLPITYSLNIDTSPNVR